MTALLVAVSAVADPVDVDAIARCTATFEQQIVAADRLRAEAAAAGAEWLDTEELLNTAKVEAAKGNMETACSLLELAVFQAKTAIEQAEREADAWKRRVVR